MPKKNVIRIGCLLFGMVMVLGIPQLYAQDQTISGTVLDAQTGETMPGVNIIVKGESIGTSSNVEGEYSLSMSSSSDTLLFSLPDFCSFKILSPSA